MAGTMAMTMLAGFTSSADEASDKPDTWIADRTITVQAYVDDIGNTLPSDFNNTETMKKITELTGIKLDVRYTPGDSDSKSSGFSVGFRNDPGCDHFLSGQLHKTGVPAAVQSCKRRNVR